LESTAVLFETNGKQYPEVVSFGNEQSRTGSMKKALAPRTKFVVERLKRANKPFTEKFRLVNPRASGSIWSQACIISGQPDAEGNVDRVAGSQASPVGRGGKRF